jgi:hypothetical protein
VFCFRVLHHCQALAKANDALATAKAAGYSAASLGVGGVVGAGSNSSHINTSTPSSSSGMSCLAPSEVFAVFEATVRSALVSLPALDAAKRLALSAHAAQAAQAPSATAASAGAAAAATAAVEAVEAGLTLGCARTEVAYAVSRNCGAKPNRQ